MDGKENILRSISKSFSLWRRSGTIYVKNRIIVHANYVINIEMVHSKLKPGG